MGLYQAWPAHRDSPAADDFSQNRMSVESTNPQNGVLRHYYCEVAVHSTSLLHAHTTESGRGRRLSGVVRGGTRSGRRANGAGIVHWAAADAVPNACTFDIASDSRELGRPAGWRRCAASINHSAPSGPSVIVVGSLAGLGSAYSVKTPLVVMRPILAKVLLLYLLNHIAPSGPAAIALSDKRSRVLGDLRPQGRSDHDDNQSAEQAIPQTKESLAAHSIPPYH